MPQVLIKDIPSTIPLIGLGTWQTDDFESMHRALEAAIDAGYRMIDTAFVYKNEKFIGQSLQKLFQMEKVQREDIFITTKLPMNGLRAENVERFLKLSLKALQMEYVDLYLIHFPVGVKGNEGEDGVLAFEGGDFKFDDEVDLKETWKAMESLVDKGLAKSIGISNFNTRQAQMIYDAARIKPAVLQVECHAYLTQQKLFSLCQELKMAFTAYSPIGTPGLPEFIRKTYHFDGFKPDKLLDDPEVIQLASKYEKTPAQILLRFLVQRGITVIPKSSNPERIRENMQIFDFYLEEDDMNTLMSLDRNYRYFKFELHEGIKEHPEYPFNE